MHLRPVQRVRTGAAHRSLVDSCGQDVGHRGPAQVGVADEEQHSCLPGPACLLRSSYGRRAVTPRILLSPPDTGALEEEYVVRALRSGWVAPVGPDLTAFEAEL